METWVARMYMMRPEEVEALPLETGSTNRPSLPVRTNHYVLIELMKVLTETFPSTKYVSPQKMGKRAELTSAQLTSRNLKASRTKQRGRRREEILYPYLLALSSGPGQSREMD
jgi:hypothetical protein